MTAQLYDFTAYRLERLERERRIDRLTQELILDGLEYPVSAVERACIVAAAQVEVGRTDDEAMAAARTQLTQAVAVDEE